MRRFLALTAGVLLTGCSTLSMISDYNKNLTDYTGDKKVGIAFNTYSEQVRVYPEVNTCIDLYSKNNGFLPRSIAAINEYTDKNKIGIPDVEGMSKKSQKFWVNANGNIAIRVIYTGETGAKNYFAPKFSVAESIIAFKPQPGAFYYVTIDFDYQNPQTGKYLRVYQIDDSAGKKQLKHVKILNIDNCPGQKPWYQQSGAVM
ncbi:hypothetical protein SJI19_11640 [Acerihabitans sp. TG2]|uniref:hypothetical protein n=1 Tax=Acerihabitans sp. TG2 TaxID=3096008 RepID=UPI002B239391|nr:hypothetical protein [Acerihabitans sp. TG2]MEA9391183.1 hypothetical protein [Acerihabitans sp. TG2]